MNKAHLYAQESRQHVTALLAQCAPMSNQTMIILYSEPVSVSCQACTGKPGSQCTGFHQHTTTFAENRMRQCTHSRMRVHACAHATEQPDSNRAAQQTSAPAFRIPSANPLKSTDTCEAVSTILTPTEVIPTCTSLRPCAALVWCGRITASGSQKLPQ